VDSRNSIMSHLLMSHYKWILETPLFNKLLEYTFIHSFIHSWTFVNLLQFQIMLPNVSPANPTLHPHTHTHTHTHNMPTIIQLSFLQVFTFLLMQWKPENAVQKIMHLLSRAILLFFHAFHPLVKFESFEEANHG
jgi:hypothetical protein